MKTTSELLREFWDDLYRIAGQEPPEGSGEQAPEEEVKPEETK